MWMFRPWRMEPIMAWSLWTSVLLFLFLNLAVLSVTYDSLLSPRFLISLLGGELLYPRLPSDPLSPFFALHLASLAALGLGGLRGFGAGIKEEEGSVAFPYSQTAPSPQCPMLGGGIEGSFVFFHLCWAVPLSRQQSFPVGCRPGR